jgi:hypothetical protein
LARGRVVALKGILAQQTAEGLFAGPAVAQALDAGVGEDADHAVLRGVAMNA